MLTACLLQCALVLYPFGLLRQGLLYYYGVLQNNDEIAHKKIKFKKNANRAFLYARNKGNTNQTKMPSWKNCKTFRYILKDRTSRPSNRWRIWIALFLLTAVPKVMSLCYLYLYMEATEWPVCQFVSALCQLLDLAGGFKSRLVTDVRVHLSALSVMLMGLTQ